MMVSGSLSALARGVCAGERRAIAKAITLVESERGRDRCDAEALLRELRPFAGRSLRVGITGAPGVGKSTLLDALGSHAVREGKRVSVLAIDPSSVQSGGSLLGDRTRMARLSASPNAFVRPSPSSGAQGGIGPRSREALIVLESAGYDLVMVETVGVGQGELAVTDLTDLLIVLLMAGAGDDVQGMKRGILEHADLVVFTKADGPSLEEARAARDRLQALFSLFRREEPSVLAISAFSEVDAAELWTVVLRRQRRLFETGEFDRRRQTQRLAWFRGALEEALWERFSKNTVLAEERSRLEVAVERGDLLPTEAARRLIERL